jgi:ferredoxin/flavodoxin---NADP+ reductase
MTTNSQPLHIAIVGSGPGGFFCADYLLRLAKPCAVSMFERWPWPFGLVRDAVAPDKPNIRAAATSFAKTGLQKHFSFIGNITVGKDILLDELYSYYHAVIIATGASLPRPLMIQGEVLSGCVNALSLSGWYNGCPDCAFLHPNLETPSAVIIGAGNAALDVARVLLAPPETLRNTDISGEAFKMLEQSCLTDVHIIARRGPFDVRFAPHELELIAAIPDCAVKVHEDESLLLESLTDPAFTRMQKAYRKALFNTEGRRRLHLHFNLSPVAILGDNSVTGVLLEGSGQGHIHIPCGMVVNSTGQAACPIPGIPFDKTSGNIANLHGRILQEDLPVPGLYTAGSVKRGANSLIGANKPDCLETVRSIIEDKGILLTASLQDEDVLLSLLKKRGVRPVSFTDWLRLDGLEQQRGLAKGKPRERFLAVEEALAALERENERGGEAPHL